MAYRPIKSQFFTCVNVQPKDAKIYTNVTFQSEKVSHSQSQALNTVENHLNLRFRGWMHLRLERVHIFERVVPKSHLHLGSRRGCVTHVFGGWDVLSFLYFDETGVGMPFVSLTFWFSLAFEHFPWDLVMHNNIRLCCISLQTSSF